MAQQAKDIVVGESSKSQSYVPANYVEKEATPLLDAEDVASDGKEFWLVQLPPGFREELEALDGAQVKVNSQVEDGEIATFTLSNGRVISLVSQQQPSTSSLTALIPPLGRASQCSRRIRRRISIVDGTIIPPQSSEKEKLAQLLPPPNLSLPPPPARQVAAIEAPAAGEGGSGRKEGEGTVTVEKRGDGHTSAGTHKEREKKRSGETHKENLKKTKKAPDITA